MNWLRTFRQDHDSTRRLRAGRRPIVETLEGRQLLTGLVGQHVGVVSDGIQGNHIGTSVATVEPGQGAHVNIIAILAVPLPKAK